MGTEEEPEKSFNKRVFPHFLVLEQWFQTRFGFGSNKLIFSISLKNRVKMSLNPGKAVAIHGQLKRALFLPLSIIIHIMHMEASE